MTILSDHDVEGQALLLWAVLAAEGWLDLLELKQVTLSDLGLPHTASDRAVWRLAQSRRMILLTANRNMRDLDSLERTLRDENGPASLPILTISDPDRMSERAYRERCAERLVEIVLYLDQYLGVGRIFIP